ncbi:hypothetical protein HUJ04_011122 [Dendroctonus ponderosae]|nr:hypothetical protein HUJ04_011122 [Dendroctonus ponderosae]
MCTCLEAITTELLLQDKVLEDLQSAGNCLLCNYGKLYKTASKDFVATKWKNDTMLDKPDNVMISKWMPQFDILSKRANLRTDNCSK